MKWMLGISGSEQMNPGYACRSCHLGQNFEGQNPTLVSNPQYAMFFMGTAYPNFNEPNLCFAKDVPDGGVIEILGPGNMVVLTLPIDPASGNFRSTSVDATVPLPYGARIRANGKTRQMSARQMNGDCNSCHTEQGNQGAPGRIVFPE